MENTTRGPTDASLQMRLQAARESDAAAKERLFASCRSYLAVAAVVAYQVYRVRALSRYYENRRL